MELAQQQLHAVVSSHQEGSGVRSASKVRGANGVTGVPQQQQQQQAVCIAALLSATVVSLPETAAAAAAGGGEAGIVSCKAVTRRALLLLQQLALQPESGTLLPASAAAGVLYRALSQNLGLLRQLATEASSSSRYGSVLQEMAAGAVAHLLQQQQQQQQEGTARSGSASELQQLQTVAFINAAHLTLTRTASSKSAAGTVTAAIAEDSCSSHIAAVLDGSLLLLNALVPSTPCWPGLPPDYITMDDIIAAGTAGVTRVTPSGSSGGEQQQRLVTAGLLVGLRDAVAVAPRQLLLQLHHLLENAALSNTTSTVIPGQQQQQVLSWLQLLLVVLEASHGPQSLTLVSSHSSHYCAALVNIISQTQLLLTAQDSPVVAEGLPAVGVLRAGPWPQQQQQQQLAAVSWALRCLESMVGREATFHLPSTVTAAIMAAVTSVLQQLLQLVNTNNSGTDAVPGYLQWQRQQEQLVSADAVSAVYCSSCNVLVALLRHRAGHLQRQMHLMNAAGRVLLLLLLAEDRSLRGALMTHAVSKQQGPVCLQQGAEGLQQGLESSKAAPGELDQQPQQQQHSLAGLRQRAQLLVRCGAQLGRVYEALAEHGQQLGRQCHYVITEYVMHVASAAPASLAGLLAAAAAVCEGSSSTGVVRTVGVLTTSAAAANDQQCMSAVSTEVAAAVRRGACLLFGVLRPAEVQAVHQVISQGVLGSVRWEALAGLRAEFEAQHKHSGKV
jgi:hypothetical protein